VIAEAPSLIQARLLVRWIVQLLASALKTRYAVSGARAALSDTIGVAGLFFGMYPIYDVSGSLPDRPETLGSKAKAWLIPNRDLGLSAKPYLFKVGRPNTGENWAEKACCEMLKQLMIPAPNMNLRSSMGPMA
jgi:hypothetical protein